ncbi:MAG: site-2 protease family protein [Candidatus Liptonbacteria bacterium]|nr:site-2 protease family protein [Candidatus Liptonbacteria bacterium]
MGDPILLIFQLLVLVLSVVVHELSHGYVAERLGDPTARLAGRLTFNPLKHLDPFGSFMLPALLWFLTGGQMMFGWAKPVPYNPLNLKDPLAGGGKIAAAGPLSNFFIAAVFGILFRILSASGFVTEFSAVLFSIVIYINILLAVFNLVPIPPLDGSKVLFSVLPKKESSVRLAMFLERYGMALVIFFIFFGFDLILPIINLLFRFIAGWGAAL